MARRMVLAASCVVLISSTAVAGAMEMTCKNPRRSDLVNFDGEANTFRLSAEGADSAYTVERIENREQGLIVRGRTVKGGPNFVAYLTGRKRIVFAEGGQIIQTDPCE